MTKRHTNFPLPGYQYIPGQTKRPGDDMGPAHIHDCSQVNAQITAQNWFKSPAFVYALDLFNAQYWWETHEVLELIWIETGKTTNSALFIQGIIQVAAALVKNKQGNLAAALRLSDKGFKKIESHCDQNPDINIQSFKTAVIDYLSTTSDEVPQIEFTGK